MRLIADMERRRKRSRARPWAAAELSEPARAKVSIHRRIAGGQPRSRGQKSSIWPLPVFTSGTKRLHVVAPRWGACGMESWTTVDVRLCDVII